MATFTLYKEGKNKALYRQEGSRASVRFSTLMFPDGQPPQTVEIGGDGVSFVEPTPGGGPSVPDDVREARAKIKAFNAERRATREAARAAKGIPAKKGAAKKGKK
jgi:hypothetical protein